MKKPIPILALALVLAIFLAACGGGTGSGSSTSNGQVSSESNNAPTDLTGNWEQNNKNSETNYQVAVIADNTISPFFK
jgi:ABC-type glycerol-3-phosphate transport system substrate-binding protein